MWAQIIVLPNSKQRPGCLGWGEENERPLLPLLFSCDPQNIPNDCTLHWSACKARSFNRLLALSRDENITQCRKCMERVSTESLGHLCASMNTLDYDKLGQDWDRAWVWQKKPGLLAPVVSFPIEEHINSTNAAHQQEGVAFDEQQQPGKYFKHSTPPCLLLFPFSIRKLASQWCDNSVVSCFKTMLTGCAGFPLPPRPPPPTHSQGYNISPPPPFRFVMW